MPDNKIPPRDTSSTPTTQKRSSDIKGSPVKAKKQKTAEASENPFLHELEDQKNFEAFRDTIKNNIVSSQDIFKKKYDIYFLSSGELEVDKKQLKMQDVNISKPFCQYLSIVRSDTALSGYSFNDHDAVIRCFDAPYEPHKDGPYQDKTHTVVIPLMEYTPETNEYNFNVEPTHILPLNKKDAFLGKDITTDPKGQFKNYDKVEEFKKMKYPTSCSENGMLSIFAKSTPSSKASDDPSIIHTSSEPKDGFIRIALIIDVKKEK